MFRTTITALAVALVPLLAGCDAKQLYMASQTTIGLNASVNPETGNGSLLIGWDRDFVALVPRSVAMVDDSGKPVPGNHKDAMSALVCADVRFQTIWLRYYNESMATGEAAKQFAKKLAESNPDPEVTDSALRDFFKCFKRIEKDKTEKTGGSQ